MKRLFILLLSLFLISGCSTNDTNLLDEYNFSDKDIFKQKIMVSLLNNSEALEYLDYYSNSKIISIKTNDEIITNFSQAYIGFYKNINLTENIIEVLIQDKATELKLISLFDIENENSFKIIKVAGIYEINLS